MNVIKGVLGINDAPPPPDYAAAARETAAGNLKAAEAAVAANRANQVNPYGTLTWTQTTGPDGKPQWTQTTALSETGQRLFDQQNKTSLGLAGLQDTGVSRVAAQQQAGWNDAALNKAGSALDYKANNLEQRLNLDAGKSERVNVANNALMYDPSKLGPLGTVYDPTKDTNTATQAILARVNPQLERRRAATENQLANQGITRGSEAWQNAMTDLGQQENDAFTQAGLQGINLGMQQQGLTYGQTNTNRGIQSQDQQIRFGQDFGIRGQDIQQAGMNQQASLADAARNLQAQIAERQMKLAAQQQDFNQNNAARAAGLQEQNYFANRDLNQLNALRSGSQVTNPTFGSYAQQQTTSGPDMLSAANMGYQGQVAQNNANNAATFGILKGATSIFNGGFGP